MQKNRFKPDITKTAKTETGKFWNTLDRWLITAYRKGMVIVTFQALSDKLLDHYVTGFLNILAFSAKMSKLRVLENKLYLFPAFRYPFVLNCFFHICFHKQNLTILNI